MRVVSLLSLMLLLNACAGLSKDECLMADWQTIGFEDGAAGHSASRIANHRRDCAKHGVAPDKPAYDSGYREGILNYCSFGRGTSAGSAGYGRLAVCPADSDYHAGYDQGIESFCTYDSGYAFGLDGGDYQRVCPPRTEGVFLDGYETGKLIFTLRAELAALEQHLAEVAAERESNDAEQDRLKQKIIIDGALTAEDRARILLDIQNLREIDDELEDEADSLALQIADLQARLGELDATH